MEVINATKEVKPTEPDQPSIKPVFVPEGKSNDQEQLEKGIEEDVPVGSVHNQPVEPDIQAQSIDSENKPPQGIFLTITNALTYLGEIVGLKSSNKTNNDDVSSQNK